MNPDDLKRRTKDFALRVLRLVDALPRTMAGRTVGNQLARCGTAVGANYRAACRARSRAEFVAKLGIVEEEADECGYWLELVVAAQLMQPKRVQALLKEAEELTRIMTASVRSARTSRPKR